jgi:dynein heavy chain
MQSEEVISPAREGTFIIGLSLEGGSWNVHLSCLEDSKPRQMYCAMPIINVKPAVVDKIDSNVFICPVYKTQQRAATYVFSLQLKTKNDPAKWILAGVVSIMDVV